MPALDLGGTHLRTAVVAADVTLMGGPVCGCGARGHLERMTRGTGIARSARLALDAGADGPVLRAIADREAPRPLEAHAFRVQASRVRIVPAALGDDVALVGALPLVAFAV